MYKMLIVMRTDLNMRKGKMCAQAGHAVFNVVKNLAHTIGKVEIAYEAWLNSGQTKICVGIDSEKELLDLYGQLQEKSIPVYMVTDRGTTEFNGVPTLTCLACGPWETVDLDKYTGSLKLL